MQRPKYTDLDDQTLLKSYRESGNQEVLGSLYNKYIHLVYGLCLKYLEDQTLAKDAVIDIYELLSKKLHRFDIQHFKSWLYMVSKNHCLEKLRKEKTKRIKEKTAQLMYSEQVFHPDTITDPNLLARMYDCLEKLPEDQKKCIQLFYLETKSYKEICKITHYTWNMVRSFVQNGRRNLKICMSR